MQSSIQINSQMQKVILILLIISLIYGCSPSDQPLTGRVVEEVYANSAKEILEKPNRIYQKTIYTIIETDPVNYNYFLLRDSNKAKQLGINTVFISLPYKYDEDKFVLSAGENFPLEEDFSTKYFLDSLNFLKKKGFSVGISLNFENKISQKDLDQVLSIINKWSNLAEKNKAEYFEPFSTNVEGFDELFSSEVREKSILEARKNFNGKMISKTYKTSYMLSETAPNQGETVGNFQNRLINEYNLKYSKPCSEDKKLLQEVDSTFTFNLGYYKAYKQASKELSKCFGGFRIKSYEGLNKQEEVLNLLIS